MTGPSRRSQSLSDEEWDWFIILRVYWHWRSEMGSCARGVSWRALGYGDDDPLIGVVENRIWSEVDVEVPQVRITGTTKGELGYEISTGRREYTGVKSWWTMHRRSTSRQKRTDKIAKNPPSSECRCCGQLPRESKEEAREKAEVVAKESL